MSSNSSDVSFEASVAASETFSVVVASVTFSVVVASVVVASIVVDFTAEGSSMPV